MRASIDDYTTIMWRENNGGTQTTAARDRKGKGRFAQLETWVKAHKRGGDEDGVSQDELGRDTKLSKEDTPQFDPANKELAAEPRRARWEMNCSGKTEEKR